MGRRLMSKHIYLIAGEASGDFLGSQLMKALKVKQSDLTFSGVGGGLMHAEGLNSLFPMHELSVMGISEVLPKIPHLLKRINQTVDDIKTKQPDIVITIDAPDFSFRVHKKLREQMDNPPKLLHYVAPTVWAWRPKRAAKVAKFLDGIICLFDFEPQYFEKEGLSAIAVGHSMMESGLIEAQAKTIGDPAKKKVGLLFGSRISEVKRHAEIFVESVSDIDAKQNVEFVIPTMSHLVPHIKPIIQNLQSPVHLIEHPKNKWEVFKVCDVAIAVSGTVGLELSMAGVPHVIGYRMNELTWQIVKRVIKTPYAHLTNIISEKEIVPELIQDKCTAQNIAEGLNDLLKNPEHAQAQSASFDVIRKSMSGGQNPSDKAAEYALNFL